MYGTEKSKHIIIGSNNWSKALVKHKGASGIFTSFKIWPNLAPIFKLLPMCKDFYISSGSVCLTWPGLMCSDMILNVLTCLQVSWPVPKFQDLFWPIVTSPNPSWPILFCLDTLISSSAFLAQCSTFLGSMLPQYMALSVNFVSFVKNNLCVRSLGYIVGASPPVKIFVSVRWVTLWVRPPPLWKYVCPFVGLHRGCVPPSVCTFNWRTIFVGSLHAAYSALRHFYPLYPIPYGLFFCC